MLTYELCLLLRVMPKPELVATLKRTASQIFDKGGFIRKLDNLGTRDMPYKTSAHGIVYKRASYFIYEFNAPPNSIDTILDEYGRDVDVIRRRIYKKNLIESRSCTLEEELKPAPYRKNVQDLIVEAKKQQKKPKFDHKTGLDYYPFQR